MNNLQSKDITMQMLLNKLSKIYKNRKVLVTGHTGFKGSWLCLLLNKLGADVFGYSLQPPTYPSLYEEAQIDRLVKSCIGDIRNYFQLNDFIKKVHPEFIFHLAAQSLVRESYINPVETYEVNVIGTVNLLEAARNCQGIKAVVNVTTDKCYKNREWHWGYRENETLEGFDPYSNSKSCSELVTSSYRNSFFNPAKYDKHGVALATARAGNVIGGGDWAKDRLIPDIIRAISEGRKVQIRNPFATRPWQHVLDPLTGYLILAAKLFTEGFPYGGAWNFGPGDNEAKNVEWIAIKLCEKWGNNALCEIDDKIQPHEANYLKLDSSKARAELNWKTNWDIEKTLENVVEWNKQFLKGTDPAKLCETTIQHHFFDNLNEAKKFDFSSAELTT